MSSHKSRQKPEKTISNSKNKINIILDQIIEQSKNLQQLDSFFRDKTEEMCEIDKNFFPIVAKRFQRADHKDREILLQMFKHYQGIEHIKFLQEFIKRETFLPRTGITILEVLNKSDAILEEGMASRLLDFDHLAQRIKNWLLDGLSGEGQDIAESLVEEFTKRSENEKEGLIHQLIEDEGVNFSAFIIKIVERDGDEARIILKFVTDYSEVDSVKILEKVYQQTGMKEISKIIKKLTHSLKQKGLEVPVTLGAEPQTGSVFKTVSLPEPSAVISSVDPEGFRLIFMVKPVTTYEFKVFNIITNDMKGIHEIEVINAFRKECQHFVDKLFSSEKTDFLEIPPESAAFLVEEACRITQENNNIISANISQWKTMFSDLIAAKKGPMIYGCLNKEKIASKEYLLSQMEDLLNKTDIALWFVISKEAKEQWMKMTNILYSPLVLSDVQKQERISEFHRNTVTLFFDKSRIKVYKRRLEEIAFFLYKKGKTDLAETALSAACSLGDPEIRPESDLFCSCLIKKGFEIIKSTYKNTGEKQNGLIAGPSNLSQLM